MNYQQSGWVNDRDENLIHELTKSLNGEYHAIICYEELAHQAPNSTVKNRILEIRKDELRHYQIFSSIYESLTGHQFSPQLPESCPSTFQEGILAAFQDEQSTSEFYRRVAQSTQDYPIKDRFMQNSFDEQNHAVWYLYFINQFATDR